MEYCYSLLKPILLCFFLYVSKTLLIWYLIALCFLGESNTKMQWANVFQLLLLMAGIMMTFAILHVNGILPHFGDQCLLCLLDRREYKV